MENVLGLPVSQPLDMPLACGQARGRAEDRLVCGMFASPSDEALRRRLPFRPGDEVAACQAHVPFGLVAGACSRPESLCRAQLPVALLDSLPPWITAQHDAPPPCCSLVGPCE